MLLMDTLVACLKIGMYELSDVYRMIAFNVNLYLNLGSGYTSVLKGLTELPVTLSGRRNNKTS